MFPSIWRPVLLLALCLVAPAAADDPLKSFDQQRAEHLAHMKTVAQSIRLLGDAQQADSDVKLVEDPVLRYTDNTRQNDESTLWIWSSGGRPSAILAVEYYPEDRRGPQWLIEIASLSAARIAAQRETDLKWAAKEPGLKLAPLADAEPPAEKAVRRLGQMKAISRRITAHESEGTSGRIELRPLSSPLYRYSEPEADIVDGAIFTFANGTNPEVLLVLEAHSGKGSDSTWHYALVQMTGAKVTAELDGKEVWQKEQADPPAVRDSYVNGWISSTKKEK